MKHSGGVDAGAVGVAVSRLGKQALVGQVTVGVIERVDASLGRVVVIEGLALGAQGRPVGDAIAVVVARYDALVKAIKAARNRVLAVVHRPEPQGAIGSDEPVVEPVLGTVLLDRDDQVERAGPGIETMQTAAHAADQRAVRGG